MAIPPPSSSATVRPSPTPISCLAGSLPGSDAALLEGVERLANRLYRSMVPVVLVTTEVGLAFQPTATDRRFIEVAGRANQLLAERAAGVVFLVSGVPWRLR